MCRCVCVCVCMYEIRVRVKVWTNVMNAMYVKYLGQRRLNSFVLHVMYALELDFDFRVEVDNCGAQESLRYRFCGSARYSKLEVLFSLAVTRGMTGSKKKVQSFVVRLCSSNYN